MDSPVSVEKEEGVIPIRSSAELEDVFSHYDIIPIKAFVEEVLREIATGECYIAHSPSHGLIKVMGIAVVHSGDMLFGAIYKKGDTPESIVQRCTKEGYRKLYCEVGPEKYRPKEIVHKYRTFHITLY